MMMNLCSKVLTVLDNRTLVTAESCTGGGIGAALTAIPGSSKIYKGGIISYTNDIKRDQLNIDGALLNRVGAVSAAVAEAMATGARRALKADVAVSVTGLAGPGGDDFGNPVGTVFVGYADNHICTSKAYHFSGNREEIRNCAVTAALEMVLEHNNAT